MTRLHCFTGATSGYTDLTARGGRTPIRWNWLHVLCAFICALQLVAASGQPLPDPTGEDGRARMFAYFEHLGEVDLETLYLRCDQASSQGLLEFEEAARCSVAGEVLKARWFNGDFNALLAWWRLHRDDPYRE